MKTVKRSLLRKAVTKRVTQSLSRDEFGEMPLRKKEMEKKMVAMGHNPRGWVERPNDPYGRLNNYCHDCNRVAVVGVEPDPLINQLVYGNALTTKCHE